MRTLLVIFLILLTAPARLEAQQPLPITQVLLYKNGMAYIVRSGRISTPLKLPFHPEDMNDVLKSFSAWNPDTGALYSVGFTTGIPASRTLSRFPFDIRKAETGLGGFLVQVKGAELRLDHNGRNIQGKLVAAQETDHATEPQTSSKDFRLTVLLKDGSLQTMWLSDVRSVEFADPQLRDQLRSYLEVLAAGIQDVTREVSVYPVPEAGPIHVGYLQQFPLWKTSYRIDLGDGESRIQGWAQIDNPTGESWDDVQVSLLSGAPVSFVMNLYEPLYTNRSRIPVPGGQVAAPRRYESALQLNETLSTTLINPDLVGEIRLLQSPVDAELGRGNSQVQITTRSGTNSYPASAVFQSADRFQVGDFFEYQFPFPVRIASRQSALLPFLQKPLKTERLSIFNAQLDKGNARLGARMENTAEVPLESGPVTFFQDKRYAGEAVLDYLPRGEKQLVSFGIDYDIQIARKQQSQPAKATRLTVSKGVAVLLMESALMTTYEIRNKGIEKKTLIIEHPRNTRHELNGPTPYETTEGFFRFRQTLAPGESTELSIPETVSRTTEVTLEDIERDDLVKFSGKETPKAIREKLGQIVDVREQVKKMEEDLETTKEGIDTLFRDQERLRENLKALRDGGEDQTLRTRYLDQLKRQEDRIDALRLHMEAVKRDLASEQAKLRDLISNLTWGD